MINSLIYIQDFIRSINRAAGLCSVQVHGVLRLSRLWRISLRYPSSFFVHSLFFFVFNVSLTFWFWQTPHHLSSSAYLSTNQANLKFFNSKREKEKNAIVGTMLTLFYTQPRALYCRAHLEPRQSKKRSMKNVSISIYHELHRLAT